MTAKNKFDVLVAGAGPVGMFAALQLAERGVRVGIVDQDWRTGMHSYALALHAQSFHLFNAAGLAENLLGYGNRVESLAFYGDGERRAEIHFSKLQSEFPFVLAMPQSALEYALEQKLNRRGVSVMWNHRLARLDESGDTMTAHVEQLEKASTGYAVAHTEMTVEKRIALHARYVIGADGYHSHVRRLLGIEYLRLSEPMWYSLYECDLYDPLPPEIVVAFDRGRANILWPMMGRRCRWSFQISSENEHLDSPERMEHLVKERAPWFRSMPWEFFWSAAARFDLRLVDSFGRGRVWLAGDSAHQTMPAGVQSMNVGLREAADLSAAIFQALDGNNGDDALRQYGVDRLTEWRRLLSEETAIEPLSQADAWIAENAIRLAPCVPASGAALNALLGQIGLRGTFLERRAGAA